MRIRQLGVIPFLLLPVISQADTCTLSWDSSTSPNVDYYNVYRYTEFIGGEIKGNEFKFTCISGKYTVTAVNDESRESVRSKTATVKRKGTYNKGKLPNKPAGVKIEACK